MKRALSLTAIGAVLISGFLSACANSSTSSAVKVSASFYPIAEVVRKVGGNIVDVQDLTPSGRDAHDTELTARQLQRIEQSSLVFYLGDDFQPGAQKAIEELPASIRIDLFNNADQLGTSVSLKRFGSGFTCGTCEPSSDFDPHVWLDPANMIVLTTIVKERLEKLSPENKKTFEVNAQTYVDQLSQLGQQIDSSLKTCESKMLVTTHRSFTYFTHRAKIEAWPLASFSPDQGVAGKTLDAMAASFKKYKVTTVFEEPSLPSDLVRQIARNTGAQVETLNAVETITEKQLTAGIGYIDIMKDNIRKIAKALRCS